MGFGNFLDIDYQIVGAYLVVLAAFQTARASLSPLRCCWSSLHTSASVLFRYGGGGFTLNCLVVQLERQ